MRWLKRGDPASGGYLYCNAQKSRCQLLITGDKDRGFSLWKATLASGARTLQACGSLAYVKGVARSL